MSDGTKTEELNQISGQLLDLCSLYAPTTAPTKSRMQKQEIQKNGDVVTLFRTVSGV